MKLQSIATVTISALLLAGTALHAAEPKKPKKAPKKPKEVDASSLKLNTTPEPDLKQEGLIAIFNGKDLTGWTVKGGVMPFEVKSGVIVGTCDPEVKLNSFLSTDKSYSDFLLTLEFKWDVTSNSGVMFRAATQPLKEGDRPQIKDRSLEQVFGYQCEIDSSDRAWTGGIYGEAMGGWKYPLSKETEHAEARAAVKDPKAWNRMTILAEGERMMTWINGVPCADLTGDERTEGFISLQVHQGKSGQIEFRDIRLKDLSGE